jgi:hypothetical protein
MEISCLRQAKRTTFGHIQEAEHITVSHQITTKNQGCNRIGSIPDFCLPYRIFAHSLCSAATPSPASAASFHRGQPAMLKTKITDDIKDFVTLPKRQVHFFSQSGITGIGHVVVSRIPLIQHKTACFNWL